MMFSLLNNYLLASLSVFLRTIWLETLHFVHMTYSNNLLYLVHFSYV